jgi:cytochrome c5
MLTNQCLTEARRRPNAKAAFLTSCVLAMSAMAPSARAADDGREIYQRACAICHTALPPKLGDKRDWEARLKQGPDALVGAVIKGKGTMPPRGGQAKLSDAEIKAAVDYMLSALK